jgi:hypothetical protein
VTIKASDLGSLKVSQNHQTRLQPRFTQNAEAKGMQFIAWQEDFSSQVNDPLDRSSPCYLSAGHMTSSLQTARLVPVVACYLLFTLHQTNSMAILAHCPPVWAMKRKILTLSAHLIVALRGTSKIEAKFSVF